MKKKKKKWKKVVIILVVIVLLVTGVVSCQVKQTKQLMETLNQVETAEVEKRSIVNYISATGLLVSETDLALTADVTGIKVTEVAVEVGDYVHAGDVIAVFDTSDIEKQLADAKESLEDTNSLNGLTVAGANRSYEDTVRNSEYTINNAQTEVNTAKTNYDYMVTDYNKQVSDYDKAVADENNAANERDQAKTAYENAKQNDSAGKAAYEKAEKEYKAYVSGAEYSAAVSAVEGSANAGNIKLWVSNGYYTKDGYADGTTAYSVEELERGTTQAGESISADIILGFQYYKVLAKAETLSNALAAASTQYQSKQAEISTLQATYEAKEAAYKAAVSARESMQTAVTNAQRQMDSAKTTYSTALAAFENTKASQASSIQAAKDSVSTSKINANSRAQTTTVENYEEQIENGVLKAGKDGTVTAITIKEGDLYAGGTVVTIQDTASLYLTSEIDQSDISDVKEGMEVLIKTDATGEDELQGVVSKINPTPVQSASGVKYQVEIALKEQNVRLMIGMTARISIITNSANDVLAVPYDAVYTDDAGNKVLHLYNVETEEITDLPVNVGLEGDYYVEVSGENLAEGTVIQVPNAEASNAMEELLMEMGGMGGM